MNIINQEKNEYRGHGDITDPRTFEIAKRFQSYQRKTAENIIEMSRVVVEAKNRSEIEFEDFCLLIGYHSTSSTVMFISLLFNGWIGLNFDMRST